MKGQRIVIATSPLDSQTTIVAQAVEQAAKAIGLDPRIETLSPEKYSTLFTDAAARKGIDLFLTFWYTSITDPLDVYGSLETGMFTNYGGWSDRQFDKAVEDAAGTYDPAARAQASAKAQKIALRELPGCPCTRSPRASSSATASPACSRPSPTSTTHGRPRSGPRSEPHDHTGARGRAPTGRDGGDLAGHLVPGVLLAVPGARRPGELPGARPQRRPEELAQIRHRYGFDETFLVRYWDWLSGVLHGDFGRSYVFHQDVSSVIWSRLPATMLLIAASALLIAVVGVAAGMIGALRRGSRTDSVLMLLVTVGAAAPAFVAALLLRSLFGVKLGWFPTIGNGTGVPDRLHHVVLPAIALSVTFMAMVTRVTRSSMLEEMGREHVEVAVSRGTPRWTVIRRHVLRNALGPIVTVSALLISGMLVSTSIVETAFGMSGVGSLLVTSVNQMDFQVVQAIVLLVVAAFVVVNFLVDLVHPMIDPRVAAAGSAR